jgi:hypothetical protein
LGVQELASGVRLEILELKRVTGDLVHLSFAVVNETAEEVNPRTWGIVANLDHLDDCACGVSLLDLTNLKRHRAGNSNIGRRGTLNVAPQSRKEFWAQYQAPPPDVTTMTVQIPDARPFYDVPVEGR